MWISNQIGNTGVLTGFSQLDQSGTSPLFSRPFNPDPNAYKPTNVTGAPAASYELALTNQDFKFPQVWRSNIAVDRRLPWGVTGTAEYIYSKDVNGVYYINANLPAAQAASPAPTTARATPTTASTRTSPTPSSSRTRTWAIRGTWRSPATRASRAASSRPPTATARRRTRSTPGSIAFGSWNNNQHPGDPNNPGVGYAAGSPGHRFFLTGSYTKEYFGFGGTTFSAYLRGPDHRQHQLRVLG